MVLTAASIITWTDEQTGREVRRFPGLPADAGMSYFRFPKRLPDNRLLIGWKDGIALLDPESGDVERRMLPGGVMRLRESDGVVWCINKEREVWQAPLLGGEPALLAQLPERTPEYADYGPEDITCDGRHLIISRRHDVIGHHPPFTMDAEALWAFFNRPRDGGLYSYDLQTGKLTCLFELEDMFPIHTDTSPVDPGLLKYSHDKFDAHCQRIWTVGLDGTRTKIRPQQWNEMITHEFWWPGGQLIGFKYQDRRNDPTLHDLPWAEYAPTPTRFGLADLHGKQVYESDPLNHYHSHIFVSPDGGMLCGEGTHDHSFVYAAPFDIRNPQVDFTPMATIHTPYAPLAGQGVNAGFSADCRWLLYNDTVEGRMQVCAVRVDI